MVVVELDKGASRFLGEFRQHGALIMIEIVASGMRSIERKGQAADTVADPDRDDRLHQSAGQAIPRGRLGIDAERAAR